jgi:hypothetical protein
MTNKKKAMSPKPKTKKGAKATPRKKQFQPAVKPKKAY